MTKFRNESDVDIQVKATSVLKRLLQDSIFTGVADTDTCKFDVCYIVGLCCAVSLWVQNVQEGSTGGLPTSTAARLHMFDLSLHIGAVAALCTKTNSIHFF